MRPCPWVFVSSSNATELKQAGRDAGWLSLKAAGHQPLPPPQSGLPTPSRELFISVPCFEQSLVPTSFPSTSVHRVKIHREALTLPSLKGLWICTLNSIQLPGPCVFPKMGTPFRGNPLGQMWGYPHVTFHSMNLKTRSLYLILFCPGFPFAGQREKKSHLATNHPPLSGFLIHRNLGLISDD